MAPVGLHRIDRAPDPSTVVQVADGVMARKIERQSPLPPTLDVLLQRLTGTRHRDLPTPLGTTTACTAGEHTREPWITGVYAGLELRLDRCAFCGGVEARDVSFDIRPGIRPGKSGPRRRSDVLGWYSGRRPLGRVHL